MVNEYLIVLIKSILNSEQPPEKPKGISFEELFKLAKKHHIANMIYYAIIKLENKPNKELLNNWKKENSISLMRDIVQKSEFLTIKNFFRKENIKILPLKGFDLKVLYPKSDMREMGDFDILILNKDRNKVKNILEKLGYETIKFGKGKDDIYYKKPIMNIEIHNTLFSEVDSKMYNYFLPLSNMERVIKIEDNIYSFSKEDFFLYGISHVAKHFKGSGIGVKSVIDWWLFSKKNGSKLNYNYINNSLEKLELLKFYEVFIQLGEVWFGDKKHNELTLKMEEYIFKSGVYGNEENRILNTLVKNNEKKSVKNKIITLKRMVFPEYLVMCEQYPILKNKKALLYYYYIKRMCEIILYRRKNKFNIVKNIIFTEKEIVSEQEKFYNAMGFKN